MTTALWGSGVVGVGVDTEVIHVAEGRGNPCGLSILKVTHPK